MPKPKEYAPIQGQKYQLFVKLPDQRAYEHLDYAKDKKEKDFLIQEYKMAWGYDTSIHWVLLPEKYWEANPNE
jgi:hypothetical protein